MKRGNNGPPIRNRDRASTVSCARPRQKGTNRWTRAGCDFPRAAKFLARLRAGGRGATPGSGPRVCGVYYSGTLLETDNSNFGLTNYTAKSGVVLQTSPDLRLVAIPSFPPRGRPISLLMRICVPQMLVN